MVTWHTVLYEYSLENLWLLCKIGTIMTFEGARTVETHRIFLKYAKDSIKWTFNKNKIHVQVN